MIYRILFASNFQVLKTKIQSMPHGRRVLPGHSNLGRNKPRPRLKCLGRDRHACKFDSSDRFLLKGEISAGSPPLSHKVRSESASRAQEDFWAAVLIAAFHTLTSPRGGAQRSLPPGLGKAARWNKQFVGSKSLTRRGDRLQGPSTLLPAFP